MHLNPWVESQRESSVVCPMKSGVVIHWAQYRHKLSSLSTKYCRQLSLSFVLVRKDAYGGSRKVLVMEKRAWVCWVAIHCTINNSLHFVPFGLILSENRRQLLSHSSWVNKRQVSLYFTGSLLLLYTWFSVLQSVSLKHQRLTRPFPTGKLNRNFLPFERSSGSVHGV